MSFLGVPSQEKQIAIEQLKKIQFWDSRFGFLNSHNGIRPGRSHWLLGTTGSGKTTIMKSIISDSAKEHPVLVITTEESVNRYAPGVLAAGKVPHDNLKFLSEKEIPSGSRGDQKKILTWMESRILDAGVKIVFFDNLTTSALYSQRFGVAGQEEAVHRINDLCERCDLSFFTALHTQSKVTDNMGRLIMGEDVRGSQASFISADYFYILQRFEVGSLYYPFIRIAKHRDYDLRDKSYLLHYGNGVYLKDNTSSFERMNEVFMKRNVLGKKANDERERRF